MITSPLIRRILVSCALAFLVMSCATGGKKKGSEPSAASASSKSDSPSDDSESISSDRKLLVNSMSNNSFTSRTVNRSKAESLATEYGQSKSQDSRVAYGAIVANRLAGKPVSQSFNDAQEILDNSISKNPDADLPEPVQLELALAALQTNKLALAEFYIQKLTKSKNNRIRIAAINALGVVAVRMDRIPEAVATFREALAIDNSYEPARLNIGFLALQGGDAATAKQMLSSIEDDWFVDSGLVGVERLSGDSSKAEQRCDRILSKHPKHKPTLINCAINAYQGQADYKKARDLLGRALQVNGGPSSWNDKSAKLLGVIDAEEARASQSKSLKESEERKQKAEKEKAAADAAAAKKDKPSGSP
jgi:tetratricopeptide (TPR) repeat protein